MQKVGIKSGDTLSQLAQKYGTTVSDIVKANGNKIKNPDLIYAGDTLNIPGKKDDYQAPKGKDPVAGVGGTGSATTVAGRGNKEQIMKWIDEGSRLAGIQLSPKQKEDLYGRIMQESSGDPNAVNNWDINAKRGDPSKGILQTIGATFNQYKVPGHDNVLNPVDNIAAALKYMFARYGGVVAANGRGY